jgi:hypothetical protein
MMDRGPYPRLDNPYLNGLSDRVDATNSLNHLFACLGAKYDRLKGIFGNTFESQFPIIDLHYDNPEDNDKELVVKFLDGSSHKIPSFTPSKDLDVRTHAMVYLLDSKINLKYNRNQAINLSNICKRANRQDLVTLIQEALI